MIKMTDITKSFGDLQVLSGISVNIQDGEIYGLVGSSGAGKSTLLRCINGLATYDSGSLIVDGVEIKDLSAEGIRELRKEIGMIFQDFSLLERMSVYENIAMPMQCWGYKSSAIDKRAKEVIELVGLSDKVESKPRELSGGQKQRVAIARAIAMKPKMLLCDEATSALDPNTAKTILEILKEINDRVGITMVVVAHQMDVVKQVCDKIAILEQGVLKVDGEVSDIFLDYPDSLKNLLGENYEKILPKSGYNVKIRFDRNRDEADLLSELAIETGIRYSYIWGGMNKFKDSIIGIVILNIPDGEDIEAMENFLDVKGIKYREMR